MFIKNVFLTCLAALLVIAGLAQDDLPQIKDMKAKAHPGSRSVSVKYDLYDKNNPSVKISVQVLTNDGRYINPPAGELTGDVGYPVKTGTGKQLTWHYDDSIHNINEYTIRLIADDLHAVNIKKLTAEVDSNQIRKDIALLGKKRFFAEDSLQEELVKENIIKTFKKYNLQPVLQPFPFSDYTATNITATIPGLHPHAPVFIVGAHRDAVKGSPGSDDNASGVAGVLEVMRILSRYQFRHPVCFVTFDLEEEGLLGSQEFVHRISRNKNTQVGGMINYDMISCYSTAPNSQDFPVELKDLFPKAYTRVSGDQFRGDFILNFTNEQSQAVSKAFDSCAAAYVPDLKVVSLLIPDDGKFAPGAFRSSDHASFWDAGMKAISIGDTAGNRNHQYHSPGDTGKTVNINFAYNVIKATVATIARLAGITHATSQEIPVSF